MLMCKYVIYDSHNYYLLLFYIIFFKYDSLGIADRILVPKS